MVKVGSGLFSIALQRGTKRKALYTKSQKGKSLDQVLNETEGKETPPNEMKKGLKKKEGISYIKIWVSGFRSKWNPRKPGLEY